MDILQLDEDHEFLFTGVKTAASTFEEYLLKLSGREAALARTHLETAVMWAYKALVKNQIQGMSDGI